MPKATIYTRIELKQVIIWTSRAGCLIEQTSRSEPMSHPRQPPILPSPFCRKRTELREDALCLLEVRTQAQDRLEWLDRFRSVAAKHFVDIVTITRPALRLTFRPPRGTDTGAACSFPAGHSRLLST